MKIKDFVKIYSTVLLAHVAAQAVAKDFSLLFFTKLLIPLSVLLYNFYFNKNTLINIFLSSSYTFFLFGNVLMMVSPQYDPCRFDIPMFSYSTAFLFLAILPLIRSEWNTTNVLTGLLVAVINGFLSYLYILKGLQSNQYIFIIFVVSFVLMSFATFLYKTEAKKKLYITGGLFGLSISNHLLGFCTFREKIPFLVPVAMLFYGLSLLLFLFGYIDLDEQAINGTSKYDGNSNS
ncbi:hypothetical protein JCM31826_04910 [Thermaurantimonas aggregans]|uniref:Uncharacterized protein n=1 Tax=Thermaurantimonas aggregans TaxID=2173829 RepID=A0A401XJ09_9FLAO|nr:hypothetical protein [Thermaurantimonas aggregans]MCX8148975.1 hypothetical protein [Thermaurantimonas aggregans]GCD77009.1 hypothetical protein JCM31826_04910 [Thermaurantimonas aggregans]